jgi:hypothetical protein
MPLGFRTQSPTSESEWTAVMIAAFGSLLYSPPGVPNAW